MGARGGRPRGRGGQGRSPRPHAPRRRGRPHGTAPRGGGQRLRRRPATRGGRARARGRRGPEARQRLRRQARRTPRRALRHRLRRRPAPGRLGQRRHRRRGHPHAPDHGDRGRPARLLPLRRAAGPQGRRRVNRQRQARVVPPRAGAAHDEHLLRPRRRNPREPDRRRGARPLRGLLRRRPGRARHRRLRLRRLRGLPDRGRKGDRAGARRHPGRQRPRGARRRGRHRRRPRDRQWLLREGRAVRAGRRRPAARTHPRADRGGHRHLNLEDVARRAVEAAVDAGATDAEAWTEEGVSRRVRVYAGEVESLSDAGGRGVGVRAFVDGRSGVLGGGRAPRAAAEAADPDEHDGLPDEFGTTPVDGLASDAMSGWSTEDKVELTLAIERAARERPGVTQVENAVYSDAQGGVALANSRGFAAGYDATQAWAYASAFAGEGADLMTGLGVDLGRDPESLDPERIGAEAGDRAPALVGARQPKTRRCPVVLDAFVAASFIGFIGAMLSADAVQRGRSLFADREGDEIADPALALADDSTDPEGPASAPFDGEGSPSRRTRLIEDGRLLTFLFDVRTARRAGRSTTGNAGRGSYRSPPSLGAGNL